MSDFDFESAYKVDGYDGVAWRAIRHPPIVVDLDDFDDDEWFDWNDTQPNTDRIVCRMIGDDRDFEFEVDELTAISDDEFCSGCGALGCQHDGR